MAIFLNILFYIICIVIIHVMFIYLYYNKLYPGDSLGDLYNILENEGLIPIILFTYTPFFNYLILIGLLFVVIIKFASKIKIK